MKKIVLVILALTFILVTVTGCSAQTSESKPIEIILQVGNPIMTVNGVEKEIDLGRATAPIIQNNRTLLPVRAIVEEMGAAVAWEDETQTTVLAKNDDIILLSIGNTTAYLNENQRMLDTPPVIVNERTMLPIRFIAESFGFDVSWAQDTQTVTLVSTDRKTTSSTIEAVTNEDDVNNGNRAIVVYFSQTGTTKPFAENIAEITGSDIYEIIPKTPYNSDDINYKNNNSRANREQNDDTARPEIAGEKIDLSDYDTIYLGYPIWWGTIPRIIYTFMDTYDLSGKIVMPFCTSHSAGISSSVSAIRRYCPNADVKDGLRGSGQTGEDEIKQWISEGGLTK